MSKYTHLIEAEYNRRHGRTDAWSRLPKALHELAEALGEELDRLIEPILLSPLPDGAAAADPLEALVSKHVNASPVSRGWWGLFALQVRSGVRFGQTQLDVNARLRSSADGRDDWYLSPKTQPMLLPSTTTINFAHVGGRLWVGLDIPKERGPLTFNAAFKSRTLDFYIKPNADVERVLVDRLLARPWSAMRSIDEVLRTKLPILPAGADSTMPLARTAPAQELFRNVLRLPVSLLEGLERSELHGERRFWFSVPWPEPFGADAEALFARTRTNITIFSDRLPGCLNAGMDSSRIPRCSQIVYPHVASIDRVWDPWSGREYYDRREAAAVSTSTYVIRAVFDDPQIIAEIECDDAEAQHMSVEYEYVPLRAPPDDVGIGALIHAEHTAIMNWGELLEARQCGVISDTSGLWKAFASGLANRGRCITRREIAALVRSLDYMRLNKFIDVDQIQFSRHVGRVAERAGVLPYTLISVPLRSGYGLSPQDRLDAAYLIEYYLKQQGSLNDLFRVRLCDVES
jgi:hypothetical protein